MSENKSNNNEINNKENKENENNEENSKDHVVIDISKIPEKIHEESNESIENNPIHTTQTTQTTIVQPVVHNNEQKDINDDLQKYNEWNGLIDRSSSRHSAHSKTSKLWGILYYIDNITLIILSTIVAAEGIGNIFGQDVLTVLGICLTIISSLNTFLDPGSHYMAHHTSSKKYRDIYHQTRRCDNFSKFLELQNIFEETEQEAPGIPFFFTKKNHRTLLMNPYLQREFNSYYQYQTEPIRFVNTQTYKMV